ncbi:hypothetical protein OTU49_005749 [Cherax quadricarinatus]
MKLLMMLVVMVVMVVGQRSQGRTFTGGPFTSSHRRQAGSGFLRFDDDFDDFDDFFDNDRDDSIEDLYDDLYDDDPSDRAEARAALTRLRASGAINGNAFRNNRFIANRNNRFGSTGFTNGGFNRFPTSTTNPFRQTSAFRTPFSPRPTSAPVFSRPSSSLSHFSSGTSSGSRSAGPISSSSSILLDRTNFNSLHQPFSNSIPSNSVFSKVTSGPGKVSSNRKSSSVSPFKNLPSSINWPGGNGYFFSMSTQGARPTTYFISFDDDD